jgi:acetyl esterase/lipase
MQKQSSAAPLEEIAKQFAVSIEPGEIDGVAVFRVTPNQPRAEHTQHLFLHVHGGGYVLNGGNAATVEAAMVAGRAGISTLSVDYRMPPAHPFPAAVDDVVAVYRHLLKERGAKAIAIGGTSAGGGLALASVHKFRALGLPTPGAIFAGTPWSDLTKTGDTLYTNEGIDRILVSYDGLLGAMAELYAGSVNLKDPLISPIYGDFEGFPPTYLVTGTRDMFLSDTARTHRKLRQAGVVAELNVYEGVSHADYAVVADSAESRQVFEELGEFLLRHLE